MNTTDLRPLPARPNLDQYKKQAKELLKLSKSGDSEALQRVRKYHPRSAQLFDTRILSGGFALADAQLILAREHGFDSWSKFRRHVEELTRESSPISKFESAVEAIVAGDTALLASLLRENPQLVRARSTRLHQATLLHYVGANGFENYRQKSPKNAVEIAKILLAAGAEVDAVADIYGKDTALGLVATSVHPKRAGVQTALMEILVDHGAAVDGVPGHRTILISALHNGRGDAAEFLAARGARLDLESAAGVGRLDVVESFFNADGSLKSPATKAQLESGFRWACEYGRDGVVHFLLKQGIDIHAQDTNGQTGLHWAIIGSQLETIKLLLERGARLEIVNNYGGTALGQALWSAANGDPDMDYVPVIEALLRAGARIEDGSLAWLARQEGCSSSQKSLIAELLRAHGAKT